MKKRIFAALLCSVLLVGCKGMEETKVSEEVVQTPETAQLTLEEATEEVNPNKEEALDTSVSFLDVNSLGVDEKVIRNLIDSKGMDLMKQLLSGKVLEAFYTYGTNTSQNSYSYSTGAYEYRITNDNYNELVYGVDGDSIRMSAIGFDNTDTLREWFKKSYVALLKSEEGYKQLEDYIGSEDVVTCSYDFIVDNEEYRLSFDFDSASIHVEFSPIQNYLESGINFDSEVSKTLGVKTCPEDVLRLMKAEDSRTKKMLSDILQTLYSRDGELILLEHYTYSFYGRNIYTDFALESDSEGFVYHEHLTLGGRGLQGYGRLSVGIDEDEAWFRLHCKNDEDLELIQSKLPSMYKSPTTENELCATLELEGSPFSFG